MNLVSSSCGIQEDILLEYRVLCVRCVVCPVNRLEGDMVKEAIPDVRNNVTLKDVARHCAVDVSTVSRALRDAHRHSEATTRRIQAAAGELGYNPARHQAARRLVMRRFRRAGDQSSDRPRVSALFLSRDFFRGHLQGVLDVLTPAGYGLLTVDAEHADHYGLPASFSCGDVDGVIAMFDILSSTGC